MSFNLIASSEFCITIVPLEWTGFSLPRALTQGHNLDSPLLLPALCASSQTVPEKSTWRACWLLPELLGFGVSSEVADWAWSFPSSSGGRDVNSVASTCTAFPEAVPRGWHGISL